MQVLVQPRDCATPLGEKRRHKEEIRWILCIFGSMII